MKKILILVLILAGTWLAGCAAASQETLIEPREYPLSPEAELKYRAAEEKIAVADYKPALKLLSSALKDTFNHEQREKISFQSAECLYQLKKYTKANDTYRQFLIDFPATERLSTVIERQLDIGFKFLGGYKTGLIFTHYTAGYLTIRELLKNYPYTGQSEQAHSKLAYHFVKNEQYDEALTEYENFATTYPQSKLLPENEYYRVKCFLGLYLGTDYDYTPLNEAKKISSKFRLKYPDSPLNGEIDNLNKEINAMLAERDYKVALFYIKMKKPDSARVYFEKIISQYPDTAWAAESGKALARISPN